MACEVTAGDEARQPRCTWGRRGEKLISAPPAAPLAPPRVMVATAGAEAQPSTPRGPLRRTAAARAWGWGGAPTDVHKHRTAPGCGRPPTPRTPRLRQGAAMAFARDKRRTPPRPGRRPPHLHPLRRGRRFSLAHPVLRLQLGQSLLPQRLQLLVRHGTAGGGGSRGHTALGPTRLSRAPPSSCARAPATPALPTAQARAAPRRQQSSSEPRPRPLLLRAQGRGPIQRSRANCEGRGFVWAGWGFRGAWSLAEPPPSRAVSPRAPPPQPAR